MKNSLLFGSVSLVLGLPLGAQALEVQPVANPPENTGLSLVTEQPAQAPTATVSKVTSGIVSEVRKMVEGGAAPDVIKAFIQNWSSRYSLTADDVLRLHDLGADSDVLTTLIRHSTELQAQAVANNPGLNYGTQATVPNQGLATNPPAMLYPYPADSTDAPAMVYPYPSPTYSYPSYTYSYYYDYPYYGWGYPYWSFWGYYSWPYYRYHYPGYYWHGGHGYAGYGHYYPGHGYYSGHAHYGNRGGYAHPGTWNRSVGGFNRSAGIAGGYRSGGWAGRPGGWSSGGGMARGGWSGGGAYHGGGGGGGHGGHR